MNPPQAFGVVVRVLGLLTWLASFAYVASAFKVLAAPCCSPNASPWTHYAVAAVVWFMVGWFLLRRADRILSPGVREESVHPRLQSGARVRPVNFTVRSHAASSAQHRLPRAR